MTLPKECTESGNPVVCEAIRPIVNPSANAANNRLSSTGWQYDTAGNTTVDAEGRQFTYDAENKQVKVKDPQNQIVGEYFYNGDGLRIKKVVPGTGETTIFAYDASNRLVAEYSTVVEPTATAKTSYLTTDHLGSPRITTDQFGQAASRRDFMPYGEEIARSAYGSDSVRQKFTGYERDNEIGLDFAQARYFNPVHGRFTSVDPLIESAQPDFPASWNRYVYVMNSPLVFIDPSGEQWLQSRTNEDEYLWVSDSDYAKNYEYYSAHYREANGARILLKSVPEGSPYAHLVGQWVILGDNALTPEMRRCGYCSGHALGNADDHLIFAMSVLRGLAALAALRAATPGTVSTVSKGAEVTVSSRVTVDRSKSVLDHIFKNTSGHLSRQISPASKERYLRLFEAVGSNPANKLSPAEAVARGFIPQDAANRGVHVFTKMLSNGRQVWVTVQRNGIIRDAGVNTGAGVR